MGKISDYFSFWHNLLVISLTIVVYLITVNLNEAIALYRTSWPPYESDGFILLNLRWSEGEIRLNSVKKFPGFKKTTERRVNNSPVFYEILAEDGVAMKAEYFKVPKNIYFDYFDESTDELKGGQFQREECDFVLRVPNLLETAQIAFYQSKRDPRMRSMEQKRLLERSDECELLGEVNF